MRATVPLSTGSGPILRRASWTRVSGFSGRAMQIRHRSPERRPRASLRAGLWSVGLDVERVGHLGVAVDLPSDVHLVVAPIRANTPCAEEPSPEPEPALLD